MSEATHLSDLDALIPATPNCTQHWKPFLSALSHDPIDCAEAVTIVAEKSGSKRKSFVVCIGTQRFSGQEALPQVYAVANG